MCSAALAPQGLMLAVLTPSKRLTTITLLTLPRSLPKKTLEQAVVLALFTFCTVHLV
jgi:hypothetical protein